MTTLLWVTALVLLPVLILLWATESRQPRMRNNSWAWQDIADHYEVKSASTQMRWMESATARAPSRLFIST